MPRKVIVESTTLTKGGYRENKEVDTHLKKVSLNKFGNEKEWGTSGSSYSKEVKTKKVIRGKRPWELEVNNGDEVFARRYPSDEEVSDGGN